MTNEKHNRCTDFRTALVTCECISTAVRRAGDLTNATLTPVIPHCFTPSMAIRLNWKKVITFLVLWLAFHLFEPSLLVCFSYNKSNNICVIYLMQCKNIIENASAENHKNLIKLHKIRKPIIPLQIKKQHQIINYEKA